MTARREFWAEVLGEAFDEAGLALPSDEQMAAIAKTVDLMAANMDIAFPSGPPDGSAGRDREVEGLKAALAAEREKVTCKECRGRGSIVEYGMSHNAVFQCHRCGGEGRHAP